MRAALEDMSVKYIKEKVLPLVLKRLTSEEHEAFMKPIKALMRKDNFVQIVWDMIITYEDRVQKGWGLTNDTIKQAGMNSDKIAEVLKKKTHHVKPVLASDQIASLLPLVNHTTKHFGFLINSQSEKSRNALESD